MIETFYEQIREFGVLTHRNKVVEIYYYHGSHVDVYLKEGKPITIIVTND